MSGHELERQEPAFSIDLFHPLRHFRGEVCDTDLCLGLILESDPILPSGKPPDSQLTFISALMLFRSLCGSSFLSSIPRR